MKESEERLCAFIRHHDELVTVGQAAKALNLTVRTVRRIAESSERISLNVAIGIGNGVSKLSPQDYLLEYNPPAPVGKETGFSIWNLDTGLYYNSFDRMAGLVIKAHVFQSGMSWEECYAKGDRVVRTQLCVLGEYNGE